MSYEVEEVHAEIEDLKHKFAQTIYSEQYLYDISNVVMTVRTLLELNDDLERCVLQFLEILEECVELHDTHSPTLIKINTLKEHIKLMNASHRNIIRHLVDTYDKWLEQQGLKHRFDTEFDYKKEDSIQNSILLNK